MAQADVVFGVELSGGEKVAEGLKRIESELAKAAESAKKSAASVTDVNKGIVNGFQLSGAAFRQVDVSLASLEKSAKLASKSVVREVAEIPKQLDAVPQKADFATNAIKKLGGAIAATFAIERIISFGKSVWEAGQESEKAIYSLRSALALQGEDTARNFASLEQQARRLQQVAGLSDESIMSVQAYGLNLGLSTTRVQHFTDAAVNMAGALKMDVDAAMKQLAATMTGDIGRLGRLVPELKTLTEAELRAGAAADIVAAKFDGFAGQATTSAQKARVAWDEMKEKMAYALTGAGGPEDAARKLKESIEALTPVMEGVAVAARRVAQVVSFAFSVTIGQAVAAAGKVMSSLETMAENAASGGSAGAVGGTMQAQIAAEQARLTKLIALHHGVDEAQRSGLITAEEARKKHEEINKVVQGVASGISNMEQKLRDTAGAAQAVADAMGPAFPPEQRAENAAKAAALEEAAKHAKSMADDARREAEWREHELELWRRRTNEMGPSLEMMTKLRAEAEAEASAYDKSLATLAERVRLMEATGEIGGYKSPEERAQRAAEDADFQSIGDGDYAPTMGMYGSAEEMEAAESIRTMQHEMQLARVAELLEANGSLRDALDSVGIAWENLTAAEQRNLRSKEQQAAASQRVTALQGMMGRAVGQAAGAFIDMAISGEFSAKKLLVATLTALSNEAKAKAIFEVAAGFASMAAHDGAAAALHFKSAAMFGMVAIAAGVGANAVGGGGGGEAGAGGGNDAGYQGRGDTRSNAATQEAAQETRMPNVTVAITGNGIIAGSTPEEFARAITPFVQEAVGEAGGRSYSRRG